MGLLKIIYVSQPFGFDEQTLAGILLDARRCNARDDVTGALICRRDVFVQLLEGPEAMVLAAFARIGRDERHVNVVLKVSEPVSSRMFGDWAMLHDPARSWLSPEIDLFGEGDGGDGGAVAHVRDIFEALAAGQEPTPGQ